MRTPAAETETANSQPNGRTLPASKSGLQHSEEELPLQSEEDTVAPPQEPELDLDRPGFGETETVR